MKTRELANAFVRHLLADIGPDNLAKCRELSASYGPACPSHDYCDANVTMVESFAEVCGEEMNLESDANITLWNDAWTLARRNDYREATL